MSRANMLIPTNPNGIQVPEGYVLVQQINSNPNPASNSNPKHPFGRNWNRNQRKRERKEQFAASGGVNPAKDSTQAQSSVIAQPAVAQPAGSPAADAGLIPLARPEVGGDGVENKSTVNQPGYYTSDHTKVRANLLAVRNQNNLSAEMMLNNVKKLVNYTYSFTKILASPDPGAKFEVVRLWRYAGNGANVIAGANVLNVVIEILFFFKAYGNPVEGDKFITPALDCIKLHHSLVKSESLKGWTEDKIVQLTPEAIVDKLDAVTKKTDTWDTLRRFLNVLDNCGQLTSRFPLSTISPCYWFIGGGGEPRFIHDAYNLGMTTRYNAALNTLVMHVQQPHTPLLGDNQINTLLRNTGFSLSKFTGFAQADRRTVSGRESDSNYPSSVDLLNLCGLPLPAQEQTAELQRIVAPLIEKINHLVNVQVQTATQIEELRNVILQMSGVNRSAVLQYPIVNNTDQSIDSLLADDEGQEVEQKDPVAPTQASHDSQVYGAGYETPLMSADTLAASVDSIMVDDDMQEQRGNEPALQVPIDDMMQDLEHTIRT